MLAILRSLFALSLPLVVSVALADDPPSAGNDDQQADGKQVDKQHDKEADKQAAEKKKPSADKKKEKPTAKREAQAKKPAAKDSENKQAESKRAAAKHPERAVESGKKDADKQTANEKKSDKPPESQREEAVFVLVREHHPDLVELLKRLKATKPKQYEQAVKELSRDAQRLEAAHERDPERYGLDLRAWQLDSRIRLLTAKLSLEDRPELQEDLKATLAERADVRLAQRQLERDRAAARLKKFDEDIVKLTSNREAELKQAFDRLLRVAEKARPAKEKASGNRRQASDAAEKAPAANETSSPPANEVNTSKAPNP
jgi:hypothetical protein